MANRFLVVFNPKSGKQQAESTLRRIRESFSNVRAEVDLSVWEQPEDLPEIMAEALARGYSGIFSAGGDGTAHHIGKYLVGTELPLGFIPVGTGNALANHLQLPLSLKVAVQLMDDYQTISIDTGLLNEHPFLSTFGIGIDAVVAHRFKGGQKRGFAKYVFYALRDYNAYQPEDLLLLLESGKTLALKPHLVAAMNSSQFGNNAIMARGASVQDGLLDLIWVKGPSFLRAPEVIARIFQGKLDSASYYFRLQENSFRIRRPKEGPAQVDGEAIFTPAECRVKCVPNSLNVLVPAGYNLSV